MSKLHERGQFFVDGTIPIDNFGFIETNEQARTVDRIKNSPNKVTIDATAGRMYVTWERKQSGKYEFYDTYPEALRRMADILAGAVDFKRFGQPKRIKPEMCSSIRMTTGGEKKYPIVIDEGRVKDWVGFGWIDIRAADNADYNLYPQIDRDDE